MARYERLSPLDRTFLDLEDGCHHQHVGATLIFEGGPLLNEHGGVDADRIRQFVAGRLHRIPRYRQKLAWTPVEGHPVWVDDARFNIHYHVRHTALPSPGDERQLKRIAGRIMSQQLDRGKPLWEIWVIEGLEDQRFALVTKTHHCMIDGIAGVDLFTSLLAPSPDADLDVQEHWLANPAPSGFELARDALWRSLGTPLRAADAVRRSLLRPSRTLHQLDERLEALSETLSAGARSSSETPINRPVGPHRRFDWMSFDLATLKEVKDKLGGTVNDVVLCTVTGALSHFLEQRGVTAPHQSGLDVRAMVPVSMRTSRERGTTGNRISLWAVPLPVGERDPRRRLAAIRDVTARLKESKQAMGAEVLAAVSEWTVLNLVSIATRVAYRMRAGNLVVTNVPGPQIPLYLLGARMLESYPMLNLLNQQSLGVALFSYAGRLHWGLMADWDQIPDLHDFVGHIDHSFDELCQTAGVQRPWQPEIIEGGAGSDEESLGH